MDPENHPPKKHQNQNPPKNQKKQNPTQKSQKKRKQQHLPSLHVLCRLALELQEEYYNESSRKSFGSSPRGGLWSSADLI